MIRPFVAVLMASDSDLPAMEGCLTVLTKYSIPFEAKITSAHIMPDQTRVYVLDAEQRGCSVFIAANGMAAHLAGAVAAHTAKPVIGVPLEASLLGLDSLLATVQMPPGMPVATVAVGKPGAKNAAHLAAQILALHDANLAIQVQQERAASVAAVEQKDAALQLQLKR